MEAEWIDLIVDQDIGIHGYKTCSNCKKIAIHKCITYRYKFCYHCGYKMKETEVMG